MARPPPPWSPPQKVLVSGSVREPLFRAGRYDSTPSAAAGRVFPDRPRLATTRPGLAPANPDPGGPDLLSTGQGSAGAASRAVGRRARGISNVPRSPVRHRWDATTVAGSLVVLFGVAWLLGAMHLLHLSAEAVVAVGLMLLGASLVVTGRTDWSLSRRSWPVWLGVGLIAILVATSSTFGVGGALQDVSVGTMHATAPAAGDHTIHGGLGDLRVDASAFTGPGTLTVESVAGQTIITAGAGQLPANLEVDRGCWPARYASTAVEWPVVWALPIKERWQLREHWRPE